MIRIVAFLIALNLLACDTSEPIHENLQPETAESEEEAEMGEGEDLDFAKIQQEILEPHCVSCHKEPEGAAELELENYDEVFERREDIFNAVDSFFMPDSVGGEMPDSERELLLEWIDQGAPL